MLGYPKSFARLVDLLKKMPGIGQKTAQRLAFYVLKLDDKAAKELTQVILDVRASLIVCSTCFMLTDTDPCGICADSRRDPSLICVVEEPKDLMVIERTGEYHGLYHVLGGTISPLEGRTAEKLRIAELLHRTADPRIREIIMATNPNVEGEATALYVARLLKMNGRRTTRIARGIPVGGDLEFADEMTMTRALEGRQEMQ
jgi:recombination protein RecR